MCRDLNALLGERDAITSSQKLQVMKPIRDVAFLIEWHWLTYPNLTERKLPPPLNCTTFMILNSIAWF